jgi:hypothetical protein
MALLGLYEINRRAAQDQWVLTTGQTSGGPPLAYLPEVNTYGYVGGDPVNLVDPFGLYGTASCSYYSQACSAVGGYACVAKGICPIFPTGQPNGWLQCTRQCLQEEHKRRSQGGGSCPLKDNPYTDHTTCFTACWVNSSNPGLPNSPPRPGSNPHW